MSNWNRTLPLPSPRPQAHPSQPAPADQPPTPPSCLASTLLPPAAPVPAELRDPPSIPAALRDPASLPVALHDPASIPAALRDPASIPVAFRDPPSIPVAFRDPPSIPVAFRDPVVSAPEPTPAVGARRGMPTIPSAQAQAPAPPAPVRPAARVPARTDVHLGTTAARIGSDVHEASPAVRTASEPEPLPPNAPRWMHEGRALARLIEGAIASGDATPYLRLGIERAAWALQLGGQPGAQVARLCALIERLHRVLRGAKPEDVGALIGDCAAILRSGLTPAQLGSIRQAELLSLVEQMQREPSPQRARRLAAQRLLGWSGLPDAWVDDAIEAALAER